MREIKFRALTCTAGTFVHGDLVRKNGHTYIVNSDGEYKVNPKTVGQLTPKQDLNGDNIYEDDYLKFDDPEYRAEAHTIPYLVVFDEHTCVIAEAEKQLSTDLDQFIHDLEDGRTSAHKLSEPLRIAQKDYIKAFHGSPDGTAWLMAMQTLRSEAVEHFRKLHEDRYMNIYRMVSLQKTDYNKFLAQLTYDLHDKLCDCMVFEHD